MKKIVRLVFWLSLMLMMMPLLGCSTTTCSKKNCLTFPKGGPAMGGVYRRLSTEDKKIANEYFNRLYKFSQLPAFCKADGGQK